MAQIKQGIKIISLNKKAGFSYFLSDYLEVGLVLTGTEIKSIRNGKVNISDSYVSFNNNEGYIINMNISPYEKGNIFNHDPLRNRKLLMHKNEIRKYGQKAILGGYTVVPTKIYLRNGKCKLEIALGKGKKLFDKREDKKKADIKRDIAKEIKNRNNY